jgi:zinc protease
VLWTAEPTHDGEREFTIRRKGEIQIVTVSYRLPSSLHPDSLALNFASEILTDTPNGRLHKALVETGKAAQVFSYMIETKDPGFIVFGAVVKRGDPVEPVRLTLIEVIESGFRDSPVSEAELARTVSNSRRFRARAREPAIFRSRTVRIHRAGDWRLFFHTRTAWKDQHAQQIREAATVTWTRQPRRRFFIPEDQPQRAEIPTAPTPRRCGRIQPSEKGTMVRGIRSIVGNIDKRTRVLSFGDLEVALLPKQNRGNTVNVQTNFRWGDAATLKGRMVQSELAGAMIARGTDKRTRQQIADEMTRLQITGGPTSFQTTRAHLPDALRLLAELMRSASFPASEYEQLQRQIVTGLAAQLDNPETISRDAMSSHFNTYPPGPATIR